ncbi:homoserine O-succinyltransferase [bacterium]|nr:homoserine O-succinyltransferase [bacterium]
MPLVGHLALPTFTELRAAGQDVLTLDQALRQDIRELHIGFLNMMPDAALRSTERQFFQLLGSCNQIAQIYVHPFSIPGLDRSPDTQSYIDNCYEKFELLREAGLDALIITGANVATPDLVNEPLWQPLQEVIGWAARQVTSVLCSCLATHALLKSLYGIDRQPLTQKRWGVYRHRCAKSRHPLLRNINTLFDVPHSRHNEITRQQLERAGLHVLIESCQGDVHLAVSPDQLRFVFLQGHPEYDFNSLFKEYKRELVRFDRGERPDRPPLPENYFDETTAHLALSRPLAESLIEAELHNTWGDTGKAIFNNWLGLVYRLTHVDRRLPFVDGIDPEDPLQLRPVS